MADGSEARSEAHVHAGRITKIERYKWVRSGEKGELRWVSPAVIRFDEHYQRDAQEAKIRAIAHGFSWPAFGVPIVGERSDGTLWGIDGQHRILAARRRADVTEIPVIVFRLTEAEEASAFLGANTLRRPLNGHEKYRAGIVIKDPAHIFVDELIRKADRVPAKGQSGRSVCCLRHLVTLANDPTQRELLSRVWPLVVRLTHGVPLQVMHVEPLVYIERHGSEPITSPRWSKRLLSLGPEGVVLASTKAAALYARGGAKVWAQGIVAVLNKNLREDRHLTLRDPKSGQTLSQTQ